MIVGLVGALQRATWQQRVAVRKLLSRLQPTHTVATSSAGWLETDLREIFRLPAPRVLITPCKAIEGCGAVVALLGPGTAARRTANNAARAGMEAILVMPDGTVSGVACLAGA